jgi:sugar O-acyltransferase (sialic acid O-acetyltransferase NeuD family)
MSEQGCLIVGAGGHAKVVIDALLSGGRRVLGCHDDDPALAGTEVIGGVRVLGTTAQLPEGPADGVRMIVAIGDNGTRRRLANRDDAAYAVAVAPSAVPGLGVSIGAGSMVLQSVVVNADTVVGRHAILNTACSVDHDCRIGDFVHIAPGGRLGGNVTVGEGAFLGIGVAVLPGIRIGRWSVVGAGAVVTRDIPDNCTAVGVPARVIGTRNAGWHLA